jgi:hypothetical protein
MNILEAARDPNLFGPWFRAKETWQAWFAFIAVLFALPMTDEQLAICHKHTGRDDVPTEPCSEAWLIIGRRGGKSFIMALIAVFLACFHDYRPYLQPGERATVAVIAADRKQARVILRYVRGMLGLIAMLKQMIERETADGFDLTNSTTIEVGTASFRATRGYTYAAVLADEIAFWRTDDAANPDYEILDAIRPGMATIPGAMLICASSAYARRGALWDAFKRWYGKAGAPLVWVATTREMNPTISQTVVDAALDRDRASASAEYLSQFRSDIEDFVSLDVVEACVSSGVRERGYERRHRYQAFVDPSGGSNDAFTLAIGHVEDERAILDATREKKPPFSPEATVAEFAALLKVYGISSVTGDRYGGEFPRELFRKHGITYKLSDKVRSDLYRDLLPMLNSQSVDLLDVPHLVNQIVGLERRVSRGGRESIDHSPNANSHDDLANAVAGVASLLINRRKAETKCFTMDGPGCGRVTPRDEDERPHIGFRRYTEQEWAARQRRGAE